MKRILLLIAISNLVGYLCAQDNTWKVYLQGYTVKSIDFENNYVWAATNGFLVRLNRANKSSMRYSFLLLMRMVVTVT